jgi:hypothetical protein
MTIEEMSKLWTSFQTNYRLSSAYEVAVLLIDSARASTTPLPVLTRGKDDSGITSQPELGSPFPNLGDLTIPNRQPSARVGDQLTLEGDHLDGTNRGVLFKHIRWEDPIEVAPVGGGSAGQVAVVIPNLPVSWPAGFYTVAATVQRSGEPYRRTTNALSFPVAPLITAITPNPAARDGNGDVTLTLTVSPEVLPEQRAALLLGGREILAGAHPVQVGKLTFAVTNAEVGDHAVRLRVDGVDSLLVDRSVTPPRFDPTQRVVIT